MKSKYNDEQLREAVEDSFSMANTMRKLGINYFSGGMQTYLLKRIKKLNIDISHFLGQGHNKGKRANNRLTSGQIFVIDRNNGYREKRRVLLRVMLEVGFEYKCSICGLDDKWNGRSLLLEIDHINNNPLDNRRKNLRFLCPNCHSQKENWRVA